MSSPTTPSAELDKLRVEVGILCVLMRTVFPRLPPESGLGRLRRLRRTLRALVGHSRRPPGRALLAQAAADCELCGALLMQRMHQGHQLETLLMLLAVTARTRCLVEALLSQRAHSRQDDGVVALKRLYRKLVKSGSGDSALLKRTCLKGLRAVRKGSSTVARESRRMLTVCKRKIR
ncbi:uncharacterized protein LOC144142895 [Haemaphysalis longicornis]